MVVCVDCVMIDGSGWVYVLLHVSSCSINSVVIN